MGYNANTIGYEGLLPYRPQKQVESNDGYDTPELSIAQIAERPLSFDAIQDFISAATEDGTDKALTERHAAQLLRSEMHDAYNRGVPFRPSHDPEMRDELAEWLTAEVPGLPVEAAIKIVSIEGLDFPPTEHSPLTVSTDLHQAA